MTPSAVVYFMDGSEIDQKKGPEVEGEGDGYSQSPINVRANKWIMEYDSFFQNLPVVGTGSAAESVGAGMSSELDLDVLRRRRAFAVFPEGPPSPSPSLLMLRGTVVLLLRRPLRDLHHIETFLNIQTTRSNPTPALQALIDRAKVDKQRRIANYHTFRVKVFSLANAYLEPFEEMYHCLPRGEGEAIRARGRKCDGMFLEGAFPSFMACYSCSINSK